MVDSRWMLTELIALCLDFTAIWLSLCSSCMDWIVSFWLLTSSSRPNRFLNKFSKYFVYMFSLISNFNKNEATYKRDKEVVEKMTANDNWQLRKVCFLSTQIKLVKMNLFSQVWTRSWSMRGNYPRYFQDLSRIFCQSWIWRRRTALSCRRRTRPPTSCPKNHNFTTQLPKMQ